MPTPLPRLSIELAARREARGYTQEEAAELLSVDTTTISRWEVGRNRPKGVQTIAQLRSLYDLTQSHLDRLFLDWLERDNFAQRYLIRGPRYLEEYDIDEAELLRRILVLDREAYPDHITTLGDERVWAPIFARAPFAWRLLTLDEEIVGYWHYPCVKDDVFERLRNGTMLDCEVTVDDLDYPHYGAKDRGWKMFISSICIAKSHQHPLRTQQLIDSFLKEISRLSKGGIVFSEICASVCSEEGARMCQLFGLKKPGRSMAV